MDYSFNLDDMLKKTNVSTKKDFSDDRFYKVSRDKDDKGSVVIRLLPDKNGIPFVQAFSHSIKVQRNGKTFWYIEDCPKTVDNAQGCPVCERWAELYNAGKTYESRFYNRSTQIISNILIVKDSANPDNDGKVFLYKFSRTLHKRIFRDMWEVSQEALEMGVEPVNMYDPVNGYNILLQCTRDTEKITYEPTKVIEKAVDVTKGDIDALMEKTHPLSDFMDISSYKSYENLKTHLEYVVDGKEKVSMTEKHTGEENAKQENEKVTKEEPKVEKSATKASEKVEADDDDIEAILAELDE